MARVHYKKRVLFDSDEALEPKKRLSGAMKAVDQALSDQQAELTAFRETMAELRGKMKDIRKNIDDYSDNVEKIDIDGLRETVRKLHERNDEI